MELENLPVSDGTQDTDGPCRGLMAEGAGEDQEHGADGGSHESGEGERRRGGSGSDSPESAWPR